MLHRPEARRYRAPLMALLVCNLNFKSSARLDCGSIRLCKPTVYRTRTANHANQIP